MGCDVLLRLPCKFRKCSACATCWASVPGIQIVGPTDAGKSTLCKILINYAIRCRWTPALVDLDIGR